MTYWDGWERMRFNAAAIEPGGEGKEVATRMTRLVYMGVVRCAPTSAECLGEPRGHGRTAKTNVTMRLVPSRADLSDLIGDLNFSFWC